MLTHHTHRSRLAARQGGLLKGCLIAFGVLAFLGLCAGIYVWMHWRGWAADAAKAGVRSAVQQSQLSEDQKSRIIKRIDSLANDFDSGKLSVDQMVDVLKQIGESPLLPLGMVKAAEEKYIKPSALTAEEKAGGVRSLQRMARGVYEKKIPNSAMEEVIAPIETTGTNGQKQLKDKVTTEELKTFLAAAKKKADDAAIPDEAYEVDVAAEIEKAIDKALGQAPAPK